MLEIIVIVMIGIVLLFFLKKDFRKKEKTSSLLHNKYEKNISKEIESWNNYIEVNNTSVISEYMSDNGRKNYEYILNYAKEGSISVNFIKIFHIKEEMITSLYEKLKNQDDCYSDFNKSLNKKITFEIEAINRLLVEQAKKDNQFKLKELELVAKNDEELIKRTLSDNSSIETQNQAFIEIEKK